MNKTVTSESPQTSKPQVSERKASANRANAQRSTGPRTPAGKARSSLNALRHGILAKAAFNVTIEGAGRRAEFEAIVAGLAQEFQPRTITEHMMVQQIAGGYWKLAKVWTHETEAAWRGWAGYSMPLEEMKEYEDFNDVNMEHRIATLSAAQDRFFPKAGLGKPTIPTGASARTILRYQASINALLFRCINFLERRRKERMASEEAFEELDYINEPTAEAPPKQASEPETPTIEESKEKSAQPANGADLHKRTQKDAADAGLSSHEEVKTGAETPAAAPVADPKRRETT
jgi:hypothetical protein